MRYIAAFFTAALMLLPLAACGWSSPSTRGGRAVRDTAAQLGAFQPRRRPDRNGRSLARRREPREQRRMTPRLSARWRSAPVAARWPAAASTGPFGCGTRTSITPANESVPQPEDSRTSSGRLISLNCHIRHCAPDDQNRCRGFSSTTVPDPHDFRTMEITIGPPSKTGALTGLVVLSGQPL